LKINEVKNEIIKESFDYKNIKIKQLLLVSITFTAGADPRLRTQQGLTALHLAMEMNRFQIVEYFLSKGANILKKPHGDNR
jgi:ankyrin repeat protein